LRDLSILGLAVFVLLGTGAAWIFASRLIDTTERAQVNGAIQRAEAAAAVAEQFALRAFDDTTTMQILAQQWVLLDQPGDAAARLQVEHSITRLTNDRDVSRLPMASVVILGPDGMLRWSSKPGFRNFDASDRDYFQAFANGFQGLFLTAPQIGRGTGARVILAAQHLHDRDGNFGGVAMVGLLPEDLARSLGSVLARDGDMVAILRQDGILLARSGGHAELGARIEAVMPLHDRAREQGGRAWEESASAFTERNQFKALRIVPGTNIMAFSGVDAIGEMPNAATLRASLRTAVIVFGIAAMLGLLAVHVAMRNTVLRREAAALRIGREQVERLHGRLPVVLFLWNVGADGRRTLHYRGGDVEAVSGWEDGSLGGVADWTPYVAPGTTPFGTRLATALAEDTVNYDWQLRQPDGGYRWMSTRLLCLSRHPGGGGELVGYTRDVTAQYEAAARTEAARAELDQTLAAAPVVVFRGEVTAAGVVRKTFLSRGIERLTGWPQATVAAEGGLRGIIVNQGDLVAASRTLLAQGEAAADFGLRCADGRVITVVISSTIMKRLADGGAEIVGYIADVTAEREANARSVASARLASLGEMSAGLAHELKQPLQAISLAATNANNAVKRGDTGAAVSRLNRIVDYASRAGAVIEHLRRFARGAEDGAPPELVPVADAVAGAMALVGSSLRDAQVEVVIELDETPPVVLGQLVALEQVLANLLINARDAMAPGGEAASAGQGGGPAMRRVTVAASAQGSAGRVQIVIADTGGGLPATVLERLFQPFVTTKGPERGTGLGLSICHGLVTGMGGTITAANEGPGAVFRITLPAAPAAPTAPRQVPEASPAA
jgi:signal transduction histidine kinase